MWEWLGALVGYKPKSKSGKKVHGNSLDRAKPGGQYGHLTLVRRVKQPAGIFYTVWLVRCECGTEKKIRENYLFRKKNPKTHCGCKDRTLMSEYKREYGIFKMMNRRCYFDTHASWMDYGGRGIKVCNAWRDNASQNIKGGNDLPAFTRFFDYMGPAPTPFHTLDRKDPDGHYEPGNVQWATPEQQAVNKRSVLKHMAKMRAWAALRRKGLSGSSSSESE